MFFLADGNVDVFVKDQNKIERYVTKLRPGDHFGEIALVFKTFHTATVRACNYCTLAEFFQDNFDELVQNFPQCLMWLK